MLYQKRKGLKIHIINRKNNRSYCGSVVVEYIGKSFEGNEKEATCTVCLDLYAEKENDKYLSLLFEKKTEDV